MTSNRQDVAVGGIFILIGLLFAGDIFRTGLPLGTPRQMGPGFLPLGLSVILIVIGVVIAARALLSAPAGEAEPRRPIPWRAIAVIVPLPVLFGLTIGGLGLVVPVFLVAFLATFAARDSRVRSSFAIALGITAFCVAVFYYLAEIPLRLFGPWLDFLGIVA